MSTTALRPIADRLARLIPLLGSDKAGEVVACVEAMRRTLHSVSADFHDLAAALEALATQAEQPPRELPDWSDLMAIALTRRDALNSRDLAFLNGVRRRVMAGGEPSLRQQEWLRDIWVRVTHATEAAA